MQRWLILVLVMFATACCSKAAPDSGAAQDKAAPAEAQEEDKADQAPAKPAKAEPVKTPTPPAVPDKGGQDAVDDAPKSPKDGEKPSKAGEEKKATPKGATGQPGRGLGEMQGGAGGKMAPAKKRKPADKEKGAGYREDFGVE